MSTVSMTPIGTPPPGGARFGTPGIIYALQHIRCMRGGSQAKLLRASDGYWYITKFQNECAASHSSCNVENSKMWSWLASTAPILRFQ